jgi:bacteriorhodopsin
MDAATVYKTTNLSILMQLVTGLVGLLGVNAKLQPEHQVLVDLLRLETVVQAIELVMYSHFHFNFDLKTMAATRYYDWVLTTPAMLFSTMVLFKYEELREKGDKQRIDLRQFVRDHQNDVRYILGFNALMLVAGYLGEVGALDRVTATMVGFVFFWLAFQRLYERYASRSEVGRWSFRLKCVVWSLYGVVYLFPEAEKNICYNFLDIVAKNFMGLYLFYKIRQASRASS